MPARPKRRSQEVIAAARRGARDSMMLFVVEHRFDLVVGQTVNEIDADIDPGPDGADHHGVRAQRGCHSASDAADDDRDRVCGQRVLQTPHGQELTDDVQHPQQDHRPDDSLDDEHRVTVGEATDQDAPGDRCNGGDDEGRTPGSDLNASTPT